MSSEMGQNEERSLEDGDWNIKEDVVEKLKNKYVIQYCD